MRDDVARRAARPPAGPIAPTAKPLAEVEPRTAINATNTPGDADSTFRIAQPGSYYLTGNITGAFGKRAIEIASDNVTIDLCGFAMTGVSGALAGVGDPGTHSCIVVKNGTLSRWPGGAVALPADRACLVSDLSVNACAGVSIQVQFNSIIRNCTVDDTLAVTGAVSGIQAQCCTVIESCHVGGPAVGSAAGIVVGDDCTVRACAVHEVGGAGIHATGANNIVDACTVELTGGAGILVSTNTTVRGCAVTSVGSAPGIQVTGAHNRVERNNIRQCQRGIHATGTGNIFLANSATGNTSVNYDIATGNIGLFVNAATITGFAGSAGGVSPGSTDANTNYSY